MVGKKKVQIGLSVNRQRLGLPRAEYFSSSSRCQSKSRLPVPSSCSDEKQEARSHPEQLGQPLPCQRSEGQASGFREHLRVASVSSQGSVF